MRLRWFQERCYNEKTDTYEIGDPVLQYYDDTEGYWTDVNIVTGDIKYGTEPNETGTSPLYLTDYIH
jgi:hypothetical protein